MSQKYILRLTRKRDRAIRFVEVSKASGAMLDVPVRENATRFTSIEDVASMAKAFEIIDALRGNRFRVYIDAS